MTEAEEEIGVGVLLDQGHQLRIGKMTVTAQDNVGVGPSGAQALHHPLDDHGVLGTRGALAGAQGRGDELTRQPFKEEQR